MAGKKKPNPDGGQGVTGAVRSRIRELRQVRAADLVANPHNWRQHGEQQKAAMSGILAEVGIVDALLVTDNEDGTYAIIDGHMRAGLLPDAELPCLVLDLTPEEATKVLLTFDPIAAMAESSAANLDELLRQVEFSDAALQQLMADTADSASLFQINEYASEKIEKPNEDASAPSVNVFSCPVTTKQELAIRKAIAKAKKTHELQTTGDALAAIVEAYLGEDQ